MIAFRNLKEDAKKYYLIDLGSARPLLKSKLNLWLSNWGFHCVLIYRIGEASSALFRKNRVLGVLPVILYRVLNTFISLVHHVEILAKIGPGFYIGHAGSIYIGRTEIGGNFSVTHNVTIGYGQGVRRKGIPRIGNNVWVGTGSVLFGDIVVGNGVTVMPGTVLSKSIPDNSLVGGNPGRMVDKNFDNRGEFNGFYFDGNMAGSE